jgi:hypothetical protein
MVQVLHKKQSNIPRNLSVGCEEYLTLHPSQEPIYPRNLSVGCEDILLQCFVSRLKIASQRLRRNVSFEK